MYNKGKSNRSDAPTQRKSDSQGRRPSEARRGEGSRPATRRTDNRRSADAYGDEKRPARPRIGGKTYSNAAGRGDDNRRSGATENRRSSTYRGTDSRSASGRGKYYTPKAVQKAKAAPKDDNGEVRLNKFIANSGVCSRREADTYIQAGLVTINGKIVTELGTKVQPGDDVRFNGERLKGEQKVYIVMNKPKNYVTTMSDPHAENTVMDLISKEKCPQRVFPVGRLDKATTGVLLFTNDGPLAEKLTHPSYEIRKIYQADLDKNLKGSDYTAILEGIKLEDGEIHADKLAFIDDDRSKIGIEIHSGRNRIVRRIFEHLGYKVKKLDRVYFAGLTKKNLKRGQWRFLTKEEINFLMMGGER